MGYTILMVVAVVLIGLRFVPKNPVAAARRVPMNLLEKLGMFISFVAIVAGYLGLRTGYGQNSWLTRDQWMSMFMMGVCGACSIRLVRRLMGRQAMVVSGRDNIYCDVVIGVGALVLAIVPMSVMAKFLH